MDRTDAIAWVVSVCSAETVLDTPCRIREF